MTKERAIEKLADHYRSTMPADLAWMKAGMVIDDCVRAGVLAFGPPPLTREQKATE